MSLVTVAEAKLHLRVDHSEEDTLIQAYINAAEVSVQHSLGRYVYADSTALSTAIAAAPAALTAATAAFDAAVAASELIEDSIEAEIALRMAEEAYLHAQDAAVFTHRGIVMNDVVKMGILLTVASQYANREALTDKPMRVLPMGVDYILQPFKAY